MKNGRRRTTLSWASAFNRRWLNVPQLENQMVARPLATRMLPLTMKKWIEPDNAIVPLVKEAFELASAGTCSLRKLLAIMTTKGIRSRNRNVMGVSAVRNVLTDPIYCGCSRHTDQMTKKSGASVLHLISISVFNYTCKRIIRYNTKL